MLVKQELVNKIKDYFDLNIYETKVWLALLNKGIASAGEIASASGVPRSRTYDVLESLEKRGFAIARLEKPVKYMGVKPIAILEKMKNNAKKDAEEKISELSKIKETSEFTQLEALYNEGSNPMKKETTSASLKGKSNITNQLKEAFQNVSEEVIICTSAEDLLSKTKLFQQTFERFKNAGIKIEVALSGDEKMIKDLSKKFSMKFKRISINAKFFIIDRKETLFYISRDSNNDDMAIWLNSEFFAQAFASLFEKALKY